jgi:hypothetical protein
MQERDPIEQLHMIGVVVITNKSRFESCSSQLGFFSFSLYNFFLARVVQETGNWFSYNVRRPVIECWFHVSFKNIKSLKDCRKRIVILAFGLLFYIFTSTEKMGTDVGSSDYTLFFISLFRKLSCIDGLRFIDTTTFSHNIATILTSALIIETVFIAHFFMDS